MMPTYMGTYYQFYIMLLHVGLNNIHEICKQLLNIKLLISVRFIKGLKGKNSRFQRAIQVYSKDQPSKNGNKNGYLCLPMPFLLYKSIDISQKQFFFL